MKPKIVVFDLGNVLVDFDYHESARALAAHASASAEEIYQFLFADGWLVQYEVSAISYELFYTGFCRATGYRGTREFFERWLGRVFVPIAPMVEMLEQIRARGYPTWLFSNTNDIAARCVYEDFAFFRKFTGYIYSYEIRSMKPHPPMYEALEQRSGCRGAEILYLDDRPENVEAGMARGWQGLVHRDPAETVPAVWAILDSQPPAQS